MNAKVSTKLIDVAAYLRMSSDKQDTSIADQRTELLAYAAKRGYRIVKWFTDEGISGWKNKQRHGFHALINDAPDGDFRGVLCWDQSRFSRFDPMEANYFWHILRTANVFIETCKEGRLDFESLGGWLSASVQQHSKAEYCKSLAHDVVRGRRAAILAGRWSWPAPYGYKIENGRLALGDPAEIETVRRMFMLRSQGIGYRAICKILTDEGRKSPTGKRFSTTQVNGMLSRETYIGHMIAGTRLEGKFARVFDEVHRFENMHPAIIDRDLWAKVVKVNSQRSSGEKKHRTRGTMPLSGLLICGGCDKPMYADKRNERYICGTYHDAAGCTCNRIGAALAMKLVTDTVRELVLKGSVEKLTEHIERSLAKQRSRVSVVDAAAVKKQIAEIDRKIEGAAERLLEVEASLVKSVRTALLGLQEKRAALEEKLATVQPAKKQKTAKEIAAGLWELDKVLRLGDSTAVRAALSPYIARIEVEFKSQPMGPVRKRYAPCAATLYFCSDCTTQPKPSS